MQSKSWREEREGGEVGTGRWGSGPGEDRVQAGLAEQRMTGEREVGMDRSCQVGEEKNLEHLQRVLL